LQWACRIVLRLGVCVSVRVGVSVEIRIRVRVRVRVLIGYETPRYEIDRVRNVWKPSRVLPGLN